jgi:Dolichyl-phosphate-mannose-protein mannosyltransferase
MANSRPFSNSSKTPVITLIVFVLAFDLAFLGQKLGGAYQNEFGGHPREAAHYMAGLYWRDFVVSVWRARAEGKREPLAEAKRNFTQNWEAHYPYLATSSDRSFFNAVEAVWMLVFPATRGSLLILLGLLSTIASTQLFLALQQEYGWGGAGLAAAAFLALPVMRRFTGLTMPDVLSVVFVFGAAMAFGDFLDRQRKRDALLAGVFGGLAILNSERGIVVWVVIVLAIAMTRKLRLVLNPAFWGMVALVIAASLIRSRWPAAADSTETIRTYLGQFGSALGWAVGALMLIGVLVKLRRAGDLTGRWAAAGALLIDSRHVLPALPAALMFATAGAFWLVKWLDSLAVWNRSGAKFRASALAILGALALVSAAGSWKKEPCTGFTPLAQTLIEDSGPEDVTLVSSDPSGEERFIAELAMREQRPGHTLLCGTQILANPGKLFIPDEPAFPSDQAVFDFLTSGRIRYIVLDDAIPDEVRREHHYQMRRAIEEHLTRFWVIANCPMTRDGAEQRTPAKLYKIRGINEKQ